LVEKNEKLFGRPQNYRRMLSRESLLAYKQCREDEAKFDLFLDFYSQFCQAQICSFTKACIIAELSLARDYYSEDLDHYDELYEELVTHARVNLLISWFWAATSKSITKIEMLTSGEYEEWLLTEEKAYRGLYDLKRSMRDVFRESLIPYQRAELLPEPRSVVGLFDFPTLSFCPCSFLGFFWE
jgi:hypothetical protein